MKIIVGKHKIEFERELINEKEINVTRCEFVFDEDITNDFVKEAYFTYKDKSYKQIITDNQCNIPAEILEEEGIVKVGVVAYKVEDEEEIIRYNPTPIFITILEGSLVEAENSTPITPSEMEQYEQALQEGLSEVENINITGEETSSGVDITITDREGNETTLHLLNGQDGTDGERGPVGPTGPIGPIGPSNTLTIGTVQKGDNANATITGTSPNQVLNLTLPKGDTGPQGPAGRDGTNGQDGKDGVDGQNGKDGVDGKDGYTPVRGVDYWTSQDIATIQSYCDSLVLGALGGSY